MRPRDRNADGRIPPVEGELLVHRWADLEVRSTRDVHGNVTLLLDDLGFDP